MALVDFLRQIDADVSEVLDEDFEIEITRTKYVPSFDDPGITYDNLTTSKKKAKLLKSCVLYVDIRNSAQVSVSSEAEMLARLYSAFVKNMIAAARYYGGHVRNIIGDRVMVVFDSDGCFENAYKTAVLMNTIAHHIIAKKIKNFDFKCGIGIDYGEMLIVKAGAIKHGSETEFYRTLVWLGRPANVASRLTDLANKKIVNSQPAVSVGLHYPFTDVWHWRPNMSINDFFDHLEPDDNGKIYYKAKYFRTYVKTRMRTTIEHRAILVTQDFYDGFLADYPDHHSFSREYYKLADVKVKEYKKKIYGLQPYFLNVDEI